MLNRTTILAFCAVIGASGLAGCGSKPDQAVGQGEDPAYAHALAGPLMTDPELASRNHALFAITGGSTQVTQLPLIEDGPEAVEAAKEEAEKLAGGKIALVPFPAEGSNLVLRDGVTAAQRGAAVKGPGRNCSGSASDGLGWSLRLPAQFPIYPRGHLLDAAGNDSLGCRLRVVRFVTPAQPGDVINFYYTRAKSGRFDARHRQADGVLLLEGGKGAAAYAVQARKREDGLTEADIVVNGI